MKGYKEGNLQLQQIVSLLYSFLLIILVDLFNDSSLLLPSGQGWVAHAQTGDTPVHSSSLQLLIRILTIQGSSSLLTRLGFSQQNSQVLGKKNPPSQIGLFL